jgi:hypothetical protein
VGSRDGLRGEALAQRSAGQIGSGHLPGAWMWVSMEPELYPICNPRFPGPVNVTLALESAILDNSLLVRVGWREPRAERQLLRRVRLSRSGWAVKAGAGAPAERLAGLRNSIRKPHPSFLPLLLMHLKAASNCAKEVHLFCIASPSSVSTTAIVSITASQDGRGSRSSGLVNVVVTLGEAIVHAYNEAVRRIAQRFSCSC